VKAGIWEGGGTIACGEVEQPRPGAGELLVEIAYCGVCGTDLHILDGKFDVGPPPQVLGHEASGVVVAGGPGTDPELIGRAVGLNPIGPCGVCAWCRAGHPTHCRNPYYSASAYAEYALYRPQQLFALPAGVPLAAAALLEPWATALRATEAARLRAGENVLVIGGGSLGLLVAAAARALGAATVTVSEPRRRNRELALARGASAAVDPGEQDLAALAAATGELRGFDVAFEVAGVTAALEGAPALLRRGGRLVVLGVFGAEVTVPVAPTQLTERELTILGSFGGGGSFGRAAALLPALDAASLLTAVEPLEAIAELFGRVRAGAEIKALIQPGRGEDVGAEPA
jgi:2-desacetyl-2-hydroxyethyl bacteriochlorophyllide A dehydrogenase